MSKCQEFNQIPSDNILLIFRTRKMPKQFSELSSRHKHRRRQQLLEASSKKVKFLSLDNRNPSCDPTIEKLVALPSAPDPNPELPLEKSSPLPCTSSNNPQPLEISSIDRTYEGPFSSSDEDNINKNNRNSLTTDLRKWALERHISHNALSQLLGILRKHEIIDIPTDARSFLNTPRDVLTVPMEGGSYCHFGLRNNILRSMQTYYNAAPEKIKLNFNIDGLPVTKSSQSQFWPILGSIVENFYTEVFTIGIFHGNSKPKNVNEFLGIFVNEVIEILNTGVEWQGQNIPVEINVFVCDAPAKAYITCIKSHSGYFSCGKCIQEGDYVDKRVIFPELGTSLRTNESFRKRIQEEHHIGTSILEEIETIDMVSQFVLDYMHLVCLGVLKKIIKRVVKGRAIQKIPDVEGTSAKLVALKHYIPCEFSRTPRKLEDIDNWKATELRQFLLYTGMVVLKDQFPYEKYCHFLSLSVAIRILASEKYLEYVDYAESLLNFFVREYQMFYELHDVTYNVHNLLHLANEVRAFGVLDKFSAFKFENHMYKLKQSLETSGRPLQQIHNRIREQQSIPLKKKTPLLSPILITNKNENVSLVFQHFRLKCKSPDNCVLLKTGEVGLVQSITEHSGEINLKIDVFKNAESYFLVPCDSMMCGIKQVENGDVYPMKTFSVKDIEHKCMKLPLDEKLFLFIPLLHTFDYVA